MSKSQNGNPLRRKYSGRGVIIVYEALSTNSSSRCSMCVYNLLRFWSVSVHTRPEYFSCQHEKISGYIVSVVYTQPKIVATAV